MADDAHGFGHAHTIYGSLRGWRLTRVWERVMETLRQWERQSYGRLPVPSACGAESQSLKTATPAEDIGCDGHKTSTGRQRHIWVDTRGLMVAVVVTAANMDDRLGWVTLLQRYGAFGVTHRRQIGVDRGDEAQWRCGWGRLSRMPKATAGTSRMVKWTRKKLCTTQYTRNSLCKPLVALAYILVFLRKVAHLRRRALKNASV